MFLLLWNFKNLEIRTTHSNNLLSKDIANLESTNSRISIRKATKEVDGPALLPSTCADK